ncbi:MAG TPA: hypothetical protein DDZ89_13210 [Clostridiales bacterium]|nr:hypothetical protein [Clostridiales bacterium]
MKKIQFIQCGDVHIGMPFSSLKTVFGLPEKRRSLIEDTFYKIIQKACDQNAVLLICGDLFEEKYITKSVIDNMNYEFGKVSHVVIIPGNHDPYHAGSFYHRYSWASNVHILSPHKPLVEFPELSTVIYHFNSLSENNQLHDLKLKKEYINILMFHGTIDTICTDDRYWPVKSDDLEKYGFDYIAAGHFHNFFLGYGKNKTIHNAGSPVPLGFDEEGKHMIITGEIKKEDITQLCIQGEKSSESFYKTVEVIVDPQWSLNEIISAVQETVRSVEEHSYCLCRIVLKGRRDPDVYLDVQRIQESLTDITVYSQVTDCSLPDFDLSAISKEPGIRGVFVRNVLEEMNKDQDPKTRSLYQSVLYYGLEALSGNKPTLTDINRR